MAYSEQDKAYISKMKTEIVYANNQIFPTYSGAHNSYWGGVAEGLRFSLEQFYYYKSLS